MARAWIVDLWVKSVTVEGPGGTKHKISPTSAQLKAIKTLPSEFRSTKYGRGKRWRVSWYEEHGGKKTQRAQLFDTKKDAEALVAELEDDIRAGRYIDPALKAKTFGEAAEVWLASKHRLKDATWRRYTRELTNHVLPKWASTPLESITRESIDSWVSELRQGTAPYSFSTDSRTSESKRKPGRMSPAYVQHVVGRTFGGTLRYVASQGWIGRDPMRGVELPRVVPRDNEELPSLSYAQVESLADEAQAVTGRADDRILVHLLAYGGLRIGEATALQVQNFDRDNRRVRVTRTWTVDRDGNRTLGDPKGWEKRWVTLPMFLVDEIASLTESRNSDDYVFQAKRGGPVSDRNWYNRVWLKVREAVPQASAYSVHDLRHVAATLAIGAGADVKLVQQMLGHKDATVTLNTYAALWADNIDEVARKIESRRDEALKRISTKQGGANE